MKDSPGDTQQGDRTDGVSHKGEGDVVGGDQHQQIMHIYAQGDSEETYHSAVLRLLREIQAALTALHREMGTVSARLTALESLPSLLREHNGDIVRLELQASNLERRVGEHEQIIREHQGVITRLRGM